MIYTHEEIDILFRMLNTNGYHLPKWLAKEFVEKEFFLYPYEDLPLMIGHCNSNFVELFLSWRLKIGK